jgi:Predicted membrane protein (DUF2207)
MTMIAILSAGRDRQGHYWRSHFAARSAALALAGGLGLPSVAIAADYAAKRFDIVAAVSEAGDLHVKEVIAFDFRSGTFKRVWREIPASRTDGIEIVDARMDGTPFPIGEGPGHISVSGRNRIKVEWQFAPTGPSVHTFELHYVARGVVYRDGDRDVLRWRLLPQEHPYAIEESVARIVTPIGTLDPPRLESRRVGGVSSSPDREGLRIAASNIRSNGWVIADLRYPPGSLASTMPEWQQRQQHLLSLAPRWAMAAAAILAVGVFLLVGLRQGYPAPTIGRDPVTATSPPEPLPAALAAVLAANGRASGYQGGATLLDLADRGVLKIAELRRTLGSRNYEVSQVPGRHDLDTHEGEALHIAFAGSGDAVTFSRARNRLARGARRFRAAINADLAERGLLDPERKAVRDRLTAVSIAMLLGGVVGCAAAAALVPRFDGWPLLLPLGLVVSGLTGIIMAAVTTPLSDEGLVRAAQWRGFKRHLKALADEKDTTVPVSLHSRWIVYGIALGLAPQWARFLRRHHGLAPDWFLAPANDDGAAFAAFVGSHAASSGAGGGGAAAGGGSSGAG